MKKVIRDGNVAVLVSRGFGAGWYSWNDQSKFKQLLFHPKLVELVEQEKYDEITEELCQELLNTSDYICTLGANDLRIEWIKEGTAFRIDEYDGSETLVTLDDLTLVA